MENNVETKPELTPYSATMIAEGCVEEATQEEVIEAWAYLIRTKMCWSLQGSFGRAAASLIENNLITEDGVINWENFDEWD